MVAVKVPLPKSVSVTLPDKSPANVITGDLLMTTEFAILPEAIEACVKVAKPEKTDVLETLKLFREERPET
jgi:hypothetical protein